jgi:type I restriction enzyme S subunit
MVEWKTIEEVFELRNGYTPSKNNPEYWDGGTIPWFRMDDIRQNGHVLGDSIQHITPISVKKSGLFPANTIIMATTATIGEHALVIVDSLANQQFTGLVTRKSLVQSVLPRFAFYYCFLLGEWCKQHIHQGGFASVDMEGFKKYPFPIPSLSEQERIVGILDTFTASIDNLKEQIAQRRKQYEYYRDELLDLEGKEGVEMKTLGEVCIIKNGYTPSTKNSDFWDGGTLSWFTLEDIRKNGRILNDAIKHITPLGVKKGGLFSANSIIVSTTATIGEYALILTDFLCNQQISCLSIKDTNIVLPKFLYFLAPHIGEWCKKNVNGGGSLLIVSTNKLQKVTIPIPSLSEQQRIVSILDTFEASIQNLEAQLEQRQKQYEYYRNKLLTFE